MSEKDLVHLKPGTDDEYSNSVRAKLKGSGSPKRVQAQQLRRLREMSPEKVEAKALELATDPSKTALEIMQWIVELKKKGKLKPETEIQLIRSLNDAYRTIYGSKVNIQAEQKIQIQQNKIESKREFLIRTKLQQIILKGVEEEMGYPAMIKIMGIIHRAVDGKSIEEIERSSAKTIFALKVKKYMDGGMSYEEAFAKVREEMEKEMVVVVEN